MTETVDIYPCDAGMNPNEPPAGARIPQSRQNIAAMEKAVELINSGETVSTRSRWATYDRGSSSPARYPISRVGMPIVAGLIAGATLLGAAAVAMADALVGTSSADSQAAPQAEVSVLAVSLTVGGAVATAGFGATLTLTRRRAASRPTSDRAVHRRVGSSPP